MTQRLAKNGVLDVGNVRTSVTFPFTVTEYSLLL